MTTDKKMVLVVDDVSLNRKTISGHLSSEGYDVSEAGNGIEAIEKAKLQPDLILLDILMPEMDGIEVCHQLKSDPVTNQIPVLFLSALKDTPTKTNGFEAGGVDFINKPVDPRELMARVKVHLALKEQKDRIRHYSRELEKMVSERNRLLIHADRLATLGTFSASVAHEINNPVSYIMGNVELIKHTWNIAFPILERHYDEDDTGHLKKAAGRLEKKLALIYEGAERVSSLAKEFRDYSRQSEVQKRAYRLKHIVKDASNLLLHRFKKGYQLDADISKEIKIYGDSQKLSQVFVNLFNNSMDAMGNNRGTIHLNATAGGQKVFIQVLDEGPGIQAEKPTMIFKPYFTTKGKDQGTGLGLFIVRSILEDHGGEIAITDAETGGAGFELVLPSAPQ